MGLYLTIFDGLDEIDGIDVGSYGDFGRFRDTICALLEGGVPGSRFATLMLHEDSDGIWTANEAAVLRKELAAITGEFKNMPPMEIPDDWQRSVARLMGIDNSSLYDSFFDVDGEPLLERLDNLAKTSIEHQLPILFQ